MSDCGAQSEHKPTCASRCSNAGNGERPGLGSACGHASHACDCGASSPEPVCPQGHSQANCDCEDPREVGYAEPVAAEAPEDGGRHVHGCPQHEDVATQEFRTDCTCPRVSAAEAPEGGDGESLPEEILDLIFPGAEPYDGPPHPFGTAAVSPEVVRLRDALVAAEEHLRYYYRYGNETRIGRAHDAIRQALASPAASPTPDFHDVVHLLGDPAQFNPNMCGFGWSRDRQTTDRRHVTCHACKAAMVAGSDVMAAASPDVARLRDGTERWEDEEKAAYGVEDLREEFRSRLYGNVSSGGVRSLGDSSKLREALALAWAVIGISADHCEECFTRPATRKGASFGWCDQCEPKNDGEVTDVLHADDIRAAMAARDALASPAASAGEAPKRAEPTNLPSVDCPERNKPMSIHAHYLTGAVSCPVKAFDVGPDKERTVLAPTVSETVSAMATSPRTDEPKRAEGPERVTLSLFGNGALRHADGPVGVRPPYLGDVDYVRADIAEQRVREAESACAAYRAGTERLSLEVSRLETELAEAKASNDGLRAAFDQLCAVADVKDEGHLGFEQDLHDPKPTHPSGTDVLQALIDTPPSGPLCSVCGELVDAFDLDHSGQVVGGAREVWHNRCADKRTPTYPAGTTYQSWHTHPRCPWRLDGTTEGDCCCPHLNGYLPVRRVRPGGEENRG